jgi:hypothetical protein
MTRGTRLALLAAVALIVAVSGSVLARPAPTRDDPPSAVTQDEEDAPPSADALVHAGDRLRAKEIAVDDAQLADLAERYGVGGAVRILAWAADPDDEITVESIAALRDGDGTEGSVQGWGQIARELGVHPGIGGIMGNGGGHGRDTAPGQQDRTAP